MRSIRNAIALLAVAGAALVAAEAGTAQTVPAAEPTGDTMLAIAEKERAREMRLLGITAFRPPAEAIDTSSPAFANYDEAQANPYPNLPPLLVTASGQKVTTADQWWKVRRPEIARIFETQVYGRVPDDVPAISWRVAETIEQEIGGIPAITRKMVGRAENKAAPGINVEILMNVTTPRAMRGHRIPTILAFARLVQRPRRAGSYPVALPPGPDFRTQLMQNDWGLIELDINSIQPDNPAMLDQGIIGLTNKGQPRGLDQWGAVRAWAWGASRALDALEDSDAIDPKRVGIFGHSRTGKAALVAMANDDRFKVGYLSATGMGGVNLYRRNYGEPVQNLASLTEFFWYAGNALKLSVSGKTPDDIPYDAHWMLALVAPRPVFISGGPMITEPREAIPGDAWQDVGGMFKSAVAAGPAWELLGAKGLQTGTMPPRLTYLGQGDIGFREHQYGHTPAPNWPHFIRFASRYLD
jgi:hypothetical protein